MSFALAFGWRRWWGRRRPYIEQASQAPKGVRDVALQLRWCDGGNAFVRVGYATRGGQDRSAAGGKRRSDGDMAWWWPVAPRRVSGPARGAARFRRGGASRCGTSTTVLRWTASGEVGAMWAQVGRPGDARGRESVDGSRPSGGSVGGRRGSLLHCALALLTCSAARATLVFRSSVFYDFIKYFGLI